VGIVGGPSGCGGRSRYAVPDGVQPRISMDVPTWRASIRHTPGQPTHAHRQLERELSADAA
jgi:hypothetical protein